MAAAPYRSTPVFDQDTLPAALRARHSTKAGVWGAIRVLEGELELTCLEPEESHWVEPVGAMRMRVEFYDRPPRPLGEVEADA